MQKTQNLKRILIVIAIISTALFISCTEEYNGFTIINDDAISNIETRANTYIITFENIDSKYLAGPSSYGENAYAAYEGTMIQSYTHSPTNLQFAINGAGGTGPVNFWNGGFIISDWNYKSNVPGKEGDWWYSYKNQCSVYYGTDGQKDGGYGNSKNFALMYGYSDSYNQSWISNGWLRFTSGKGIINGMYVCLSSYTYGVIEYGNTFGTGVATPLKDTNNGNGYFKLLAYGFDGETPTNSGNPVEIYLAEYLDHQPVVTPLTQWTYFDLSQLGTVTSVKFNFEGSDSGNYGLNTPAYVCMDNISVTK